MTPRRAALVVLAAASTSITCAVACDRRPLAQPSGALGSASPEPEPVSSARRPSRRYYLARSAARCEVYSADSVSVSAPTTTPCPPDLHVGERIRIVGMTCTREADAPERDQPVVCPDPLTNLERRDRGERRE